MKKTFSITLAGILFNIEEDAYEMLENYLKSIKWYFSKYPEADEIVSDIEARMAEQFLQKTGKQKIVTVKHVDGLITSMGKVEDFQKEAEMKDERVEKMQEVKESGEAKTEESEVEESHAEQGQKGEKSADSETEGAIHSETVRAKRRLFRNPDDVVIAGVASGIAAYFNIDPLVIRILFVIFALFSFGTGLIVYLLLALVVPMAETQAEKIQMRGGPIDLGEFEKKVKDRIHDLKNRTNNFERAKSGARKITEEIFLIFGKLIRWIFQFLIIVVGLALIIGMSIAFIATTLFALNLLFNATPVSTDITGLKAFSPLLFDLSITLIYIVAIIPVIVLWISGLSLLRRKNIHNVRTTFLLFIVWITAIMATGILAVRFIPEVESYLENLPQYQITSQEFSVSDFDTIVSGGPYIIKVSQGDKTSVQAYGRQNLIDRMNIEIVNGGSLAISNNENMSFCLLCFNDEQRLVEIEITTPNLKEILLEGVTKLEAPSLQLNDLNIFANGATEIMVDTLTAKNLAINMSGVSRVRVAGTVEELQIETDGLSQFHGADLKSKKVSIKTHGKSDVGVNVAEELRVEADGLSSVTYNGNPNSIESEIGDVAKLEREFESSEKEFESEE